MSLDDKVWAWTNKGLKLRCYNCLERGISARVSKKRERKSARFTTLSEKRRKGRHSEWVRKATRNM